jgi:MFS family permease
VGVGRPRQLVAALVVVARNGDVCRAELAWGAVIVAELAHFVALGVFAYQQGGTSAVGLAGLIRLLPAAILTPFASSLGDRYRRERLLLVLSLVGAAALAGSAVGAAADDEVSVYACAAVVGVAATLIRPSLSALMPSLARTPDELIASNGATATVESLGTLFGPLLAGVLVSISDVALVFAVGAAGFGAAALLLAGLRVEGRIEIPTDSTAVRELLLAGFRTIARSPGVRIVTGLILAQTFVRGCLNVLIVVAAFQVFDAGAGAVGYMTAAIGVGGLLGAVSAMTLGTRRLAVSFGVALVFWGLPIVLMAPGADAQLPAALLLLAVVGAANSVEDVAGFTLLQRAVPDVSLGGVLGVVWGLAAGGVALGSVAAPALVAVIGAKAAFVAVGAILPALTLVTYRRLVALDRSVAPVPELALVEGVPMFAPLSLAAKERVAAHLEPVVVPAGEVVIRRGDIGDRFYVVVEGELRIDAESSSTVARGGDYFGEIALLRDVPRTATVTALVESRLFALQREPFLAVVTGHATAHAAGEAVADARLAGQATQP